jgi:hypothetical protein
VELAKCIVEIEPSTVELYSPNPNNEDLNLSGMDKLARDKDRKKEKKKKEKHVERHTISEVVKQGLKAITESLPIV